MVYGRRELYNLFCGWCFGIARLFVRRWYARARTEYVHIRGRAFWECVDEWMAPLCDRGSRETQNARLFFLIRDRDPEQAVPLALCVRAPRGLSCLFCRVCECAWNHRQKSVRTGLSSFWREGGFHDVTPFLRVSLKMAETCEQTWPTPLYLGFAIVTNANVILCSGGGTTDANQS